MKTRTLIMACAVLAIGLSALHAQGWSCRNIYADDHHWEAYQCPPSGVPCGTLSCDCEYHWISYWGYGEDCSGQVLVCASDWIDVYWKGVFTDNVASLPKGSKFGNHCLDGGFPFQICTMCEDSASDCDAGDFIAYCCN